MNQLASIDSRLKAAKMTLDGERIRWLVGKQESLTEKENVFGEKLAKSRYQFIVTKAAEVEFVRNLILSNLEEERTVHELHELTDIPKPEIVECIIALMKWRKIEQVGMRDRSPVYKALESRSENQD